MSYILPSHIVAAIDSMFGPKRNEVDSSAVKHIFKAQVHALLTMLEEVPPELIDLNASEYLGFSQCRADLLSHDALMGRRGLEEMPRAVFKRASPSALWNLCTLHLSIAQPDRQTARRRI